MANPQSSNNAFTPIPNTLLERLVEQRLSGSEFKVLLVVLRKTIGFHKEEDVISLSQFQKLTNLPRWTVWQAIEKLVSKTLLVRKTLLSGSIYRLNKDFETWKASKQNITSKENITRASKEKPTRVVSKTLHTKESIKETIQKKTTTPLPPKTGELVKVDDPYFNFSPDDFMELYNFTLAQSPYNLPKCLTLDHRENNKPTTKTRRQLVEALLKTKREPGYWQTVFTKIAASKFLVGILSDKGWKANIDFIIRPGTHIKIMEGKYDDKVDWSIPGI